MRRITATVVLAVLAAHVLAGCAPPVVHVRHVLPAAMPLPGDVSMVRAGEFAVRSGPKDGFADFTKEALDKHLADVPVGLGSTGRGARTTEAQIARAGGTIDIETKDVRGKRLGRRRSAGTGKLDDVELTTLVRTAAVRVEFHVRRASGGESLGTVEVRRSYSSADDPQVRGELGLERADDPARVPPAGDIVRGLLTGCVEAFGRMVSPVVVEADVPLRPASGRFAQLGLKAAREANHAEALRQFEAAARAAPDDAGAHFDLAAVAEAIGRLDLAAEHYERAWELSDKKDDEARQAAARARRVRAAQELPKG